MAKSNAERSAKAAAKKKSRGEEELRLHCLPGTRQALAELMAWSGIEEQGEAITLMIHHLHALGPQKSAPLLTPPRHEITISENVSRKLELAYNREALRICHDEYPPPTVASSHGGWRLEVNADRYRGRRRKCTATSCPHFGKFARPTQSSAANAFSDIRGFFRNKRRCHQRNRIPFLDH
ncbi:hypothetical protein D3C78_508550 [compost metagenome]|jgi:hypothetical protein